MAKYYYDTKNGRVVKGGLMSWWNKMGPYRTAEEASRALEIAQNRTTAWDEADQEYKDEDE